LTSALDGGEWPASRSDRFTPRETAPEIRWIGGWVGRRAVLDAAVKRKIPNPSRKLNPGTPIVQPVALRYIPTELSRIILVEGVYNESCQAKLISMSTNQVNRPLTYMEPKLNFIKYLTDNWSKKIWSMV
jgi:hypothetical protein